MVNKLAALLAFTILLNCIQPVLSGEQLGTTLLFAGGKTSVWYDLLTYCFPGAAVGSGWQAIVAFVNVGSYYIVGAPLGVLLGWLLQYDIRVSKQPTHPEYSNLCSGFKRNIWCLSPYAVYIFWIVFLKISIC